MRHKAIINWSGGKDSALALHVLQQAKACDVLCLLTNVREQNKRISMHGVREELLEMQAESIGLPLTKLYMPEMPTMEAYNKTMAAMLEKLKKQGATASVFGDIFLEDLRQYREEKLKEAGLEALFPLWNQPTAQLIQEFLALGFKTITTCVNEKYLDKSFVGRKIDQEFLNDLPEGVDPCGENGEFHTFVYDGPLFSRPIPVATGEVVYKKYSPPETDNSDDYNCTDDDNPFATGFWYCDLVKGIA